MWNSLGRHGGVDRVQKSMVHMKSSYALRNTSKMASGSSLVPTTSISLSESVAPHIPCIPIRLDVSEYEKGIQTILSKAKPELDVAKFEIRVFTGGITNFVLGVFGPGADSFVFKIYGADTELFLSRSEELASIITAAQCGVGQEVVFLFDNGLCLRHVPGRSLLPPDFSNWRMAEPIARTMARMHVKAIVKPDVEPVLKTRFLGSWLDLLPTELDTHERNKKLRDILDDYDLRKASSELLSCLEKVGSPLVFCHNDLLVGNVVFDDSTGIVKFIDMEYAGINYQSFDIADHFTEFAGVDNPDYSLFPNKEFQVRWLKIYLEETAALKGEDPVIVSDTDVERLYTEVKTFLPVSSNLK